MSFSLIIQRSLCFLGEEEQSVHGQASSGMSLHSETARCTARVTPRCNGHLIVISDKAIKILSALSSYGDSLVRPPEALHSEKAFRDCNRQYWGNFVLWD